MEKMTSYEQNSWGEISQWILKIIKYTENIYEKGN